MRVAIVGLGQLSKALIEAVNGHHTVTRVSEADLVWLAADTPVLDDGTADLEYLKSLAAEAIWPNVRDGAVVLVSSQVPVGFTASLRYAFRCWRPQPNVGFAYCVENIKANSGGAGWDAQRAFVVGTFGDRWVKETVARLLAAWVERPVVWCSTASAEFAKCAINGLLATIIGYVNEIGELATAAGASADDVEAALRTDVRLHQAPLRPGAPFGNEHLGRDLRYLKKLAIASMVERLPLIEAVLDENNRRLRGK